MSTSYKDPLYSFSTAILRIVDRVSFLKKLFSMLLGIKAKLITAAVGLILVVTMVLSSLLLMIQYNGLIVKTDETCKATAIGLSSIAIEGITQNKRGIVSDYVNNLKGSGISGLNSVYVVEYMIEKSGDEKKAVGGTIIAHSDPQRMNAAVPKNIFNQITLIREFDKKIAVEDGERYYLYTYPIDWKVILKGKDRTATLGAIRLKFVEKEVLAVFYQSRNVVIIVTLIVLAAGIFLMYMLGSFIVRPILILSEGVSAVKDGDLTVHLDIKSVDEVGRLSESFNEMTAHLREKLQMQKFVSSSTVEMIKKAGSKHAEVVRKGERKRITVFFSDIRGFTSFSEKRSPEDVVIMLNHYLDLQTKILQKHGGDIDKYVGDEIMATFQGDNMGVNAIRAAIEIQKAMGAEIKKNKEAKAAIAVGIGINTGEAVVGAMGSSNRMDFTAIGDTVNTAARLCSAAAKGEIIVTAAAREAVPAKIKTINFIKTEPLTVKNKSEAIDVFKVK
ncbi:MAG: HAMP domain-containing protein [Spirochaetes bacterium]|nr:HAMP domain-containing protein [Spirochaetota bacterium]